VTAAAGLPSVSAPARYGRIDVHAHLVPACDPVSADPRWPRLQVARRGGVVTVAGTVIRTVPVHGFDAAARASFLATADVDIQCVSPMPEYFCYWSDPVRGARHCERVNDWLHAEVRRGAGRLAGLGIVPMQDQAAAIAMLPRLRELDFLGVAVGSNVNGQLIGGPRFDEFFAAAADLDLSLFVHAFRPPYHDQFEHGAIANAATFPAEAAAATASLISRAVPARFIGLRILVSHGGGGLEAVLARLDYALRRAAAESAGAGPAASASAAAGSAASDAAASEAAVGGLASQLARRMFFDSQVFSAALLERLVALVGAGSVALGSDCPFVPLPILGLVRGAAGGLLERQLGWDTPQRLFPRLRRLTGELDN
jgi:aminocarboxymuconate-semialdehyde decarboxylase